MDLSIPQPSTEAPIAVPQPGDGLRASELAALLARDAPGNMVYLDTETTGLNLDGSDELLEIALIDDAGNTLLDTLIKPRHHREWPQAEAIHGISPAHVENAPSLEDVLPQMAAIIASADALVIYNAPYDLGFLPEDMRAGAAAKSLCAMTAYSLHVGEWSESREKFRWFKLAAAAEAAGHTWSGTAHRALADAQAARTVWHWLCR